MDIEQRTDSNWMDACVYCDLLLPDWFGTLVEKYWRIVDVVADETQTLEEGKCDPEIPMRVMMTTAHSF